MQADYDVIILGAGPAGSTAGLYLAQFRLKTLLIESCPHRSFPPSPVALSGQPQYYNVPGFPQGITRQDFKWRCIEQAQQVGCDYRLDDVIEVTADPHYFMVKSETQTVTADALFFALGLEESWPVLEDFIGDQAAHIAGLYGCVETNGPQALHQYAGVIGWDDHAVLEAIRLHHFTQDVSLFTQGNSLTCAAPLQNTLHQLGITIVSQPIQQLVSDAGVLEGLITTDHQLLPIRALFYPERILMPHSLLAQSLGVHVDGQGFIQVNERFETNIQNVYAIGDIASRGPEQVITATYHGMMAARAFYEETFQHSLHHLLTHSKTAAVTV